MPQGGNHRVNSPVGRPAGSTLDLFDPDRLDQPPGPQSRERRGESSFGGGGAHRWPAAPVSPVVWETSSLPAMALCPLLSPGALSCHSCLCRQGPALWSTWGLTLGLAPSGDRWLPFGTSDDSLTVLSCPEHSTGFLVFKGPR